MESLDRFVPLPENRAAFDAAVRFGPHSSLPLLFFHGPPGAGKSHLVQAIVERLTRKNPSTTVQVLAAAEFGRTLMLPPLEKQGAIREAIACDLLAIDDLQHLPGAAANELAQILDRRQRRRGMTVLTAGRGPAELEVSARLTSRLVGGLVIGITPLSAISRRQLAAALCRERRLRLADEVIDWLAQDPGGARPILGRIAQLEQLARLHPAPLTLDIVRSALNFAEGEESPFDRVVAAVCTHFGVDARALCGPSRQRHIVWPRQVAMYLAREAGLSYPQIGVHFGGRDHTTVMHSCEKVAKAAGINAALRRELSELQNSIS
jgi:chromosomal replication initiator protein